MERIWELLAKKFSHEISDEETKELDVLLKQYQQEFQQSEILNAVFNLEVTAEEDPAMTDRSEQRLRRMLEAATSDGEQALPAAIPAEEQPKNHFKRYSKLYAAAAVNVAVVALLYFVPGRHAAALDNKINTERGAKTTVHLPDGSVVTLNSGSRLSYNKDFGIKNRQIYLEGEAYFDVKKSPSMPLVVSTATVNVTVLGTTFNVKAYAEDSLVEASLFTGTIQLATQKDPERVILLRPREKVTINQKQNALNVPATVKEVRNEMVSLQHMTSSRNNNSFDETAWLENKLVFRAVPFREVAKELQRKFNVDIYFNDTVFQDIRITATFSEASIHDIMPALQQTIPFHFTSVGNKIYIDR